MASGGTRQVVAKQQRVERAARVEGCNIVVAADMTAINKDLGHGSASAARPHLLFEGGVVRDIDCLERHAFVLQ